MPIKISNYSNDSNRERAHELDWLCDDQWELAIQLKALERWLEENKSLKKGSYTANIDFSPRTNAAGGAALSTSSMAIMASLGMTLYFSEYPIFDDK